MNSTLASSILLTGSPFSRAFDNDGHPTELTRGRLGLLLGDGETQLVGNALLLNAWIDASCFVHSLCVAVPSQFEPAPPLAR